MKQLILEYADFVVDNCGKQIALVFDDNEYSFCITQDEGHTLAGPTRDYNEIKATFDTLIESALSGRLLGFAGARLVDVFKHADTLAYVLSLDKNLNLPQPDDSELFGGTAIHWPWRKKSRQQR